MQPALENREMRGDYAALSRAQLLEIFNEKADLLEERSERLTKTSGLLDVHREHIDDKDQLFQEQV